MPNTTTPDDLSPIGTTPILRLPRLSRWAGAELVAKAELLNPGGSIKDRTAWAMIRAAEEAGRIHPGDTLVEATAGNTGIGLAWIAAARGYRFVAVMTEADRGPKVEAIRRAGAEVVLVPEDVPWTSELGPMGVARRLAAERRGFFLDQFSNPANPWVHERTTAAELRAALGPELDAVVVGVGTGGTATGLARGLGPATRVIGVVASTSCLAGGHHRGGRIPGITPDFVPAVFERRLLHHVEPVDAWEAAEGARRLAEVEGIPAGHSSGACLVAAEREARRRPGSRIVLMVADSLRNYPVLEAAAGHCAPRDVLVPAAPPVAAAVGVPPGHDPRPC